MADLDESFPSELQDRAASFDDALTRFEDVLKPIHAVPLNEAHSEMTPLDKAKLELVGAYAINSLFWMYLNVKGENPKEHSVKQELERIRGYMTRVKDIQDKEHAPKLNKDASKRFVRNALWHQAQKQSQATPAPEGTDAAAGSSQNDSSPKGSKQHENKRKHDSDNNKQHKGKNKYQYKRQKQTYERKFTL